MTQSLTKKYPVPFQLFQKVWHTFRMALSQMTEAVSKIERETLAAISKIENLADLDQLRIQVLGKKGSLSEVLRGLAGLTNEERPQMGQKSNETKRAIEGAMDARKTALESAALNARLESEKIDITLPPRLSHSGSLHVITQTTRRIIEVFSRIGFDVASGPEAETEFYNFEAVNMPKDHPARDMQDTFFMGPGVVLRTHTSSIQMRAMQERNWPLRVLAPGAVFRSDHDATHSPMFHQVEGVWIDEGVRMSDLRGVLQYFAREMFGPKAEIRLRPSYFPFVEPGCEVDVRFGDGWLEILGAGMVHPKLFDLAGFANDPKGQHALPTGFAFGMGVERIAMLLYGIKDLRSLFRNDHRLLKQF